MAKNPIPQLPPAARKMFQNAAKAQRAATANGTANMTPTDQGGSFHNIPVHNSGFGQPNFPGSPKGGGV